MPERHITMKTLADDLGVSRATVSFVLNGDAEKRRIPAETAQRILAYAREKNFRPDFFARALNTRKTGAIGLVFPDVHESFMAQMLRGIDEVFAENDGLMTLCSSRLDTSLEQRNLDSLLHRGVDGLIVVPCASFRGSSSEGVPITEILAQAPVPVVVLDRIPPGWTGDSVTQNDYEASQELTRLLLETGVTRLGSVSFDLNASSIQNRLAGFRSALAEAHFTEDPRLEIRLGHVDRHSPDLAEALRRVDALPERERPEAWFVTTSGLAHRTHELIQAGALCGPLPLVAQFGADPWYHKGTLFGVHQPHAEMGRAAAELLFCRLTQGPGAPEALVLPAVPYRPSV